MNDICQDISPDKNVYLDQLKQLIKFSSDIRIFNMNKKLTAVYISSLINKTMLQDGILSPIKKSCSEKVSPEELLWQITVGDANLVHEMKQAVHSLLTGGVLIHVEGYSQLASIVIPSETSRSLAKPENESQVIGAQLAFTESMDTNISLVRKYVANPNLCNDQLSVGNETNTPVSVLYIDGIASEEMVTTLKQRISSLKVNSLLDSSTLAQLIEDNSLTIFPQMVLTERPDRICSNLLDGKIAVIVDGSSLAISCPQSFIEFFQSMEDLNVRWHIATFFRLLRMAAMFISVFFTAVYVAALTFHYEVIPQPLLIPLSESRSRVPFPPIFEALLLEVIIELLREAGARLPTKVGQTMGIVGGIVIGTAAVDAGFTSNILLIIVALGALSSFTTPSYMMGNVIRIIRFPLILLAGFWGFYGVMFGFCFLLIHLLKQTSLGSPYLNPFYPPRFADWKDNIIRLPLSVTNNRPSLGRPESQVKYSKDVGKQKDTK
ncbi:spore germination protein [Metabacillus indicus]|uniref:spore germination protein n=1 Tax=Metabacillus indicus TaxID=246786 RepID=UPI0009DFEC8C|nr:spore germination protein [Metabacillus indicus]